MHVLSILQKDCFLAVHDSDSMQDHAINCITTWSLFYSKYIHESCTHKNNKFTSSPNKPHFTLFPYSIYSQEKSNRAKRQKKSKIQTMLKKL